MKLLVTTNARLYRTPDKKYWTPLVYGYEFFLRYLKVFDEIKLVAHTEECSKKKSANMLRVDGPGISIYEVLFPHGKMQYIIKYFAIKKKLNEAVNGCDAALLRIPDQLAFQIYTYLKKRRIPVGIEVTSDSWEFFAPKAVKSLLRPFLRVLWYLEQKHICSTALGTAYVTQFALQKRYPPLKALKGKGFTTNYTDTNINEKYLCSPRSYSADKKEFTAIHVSAHINGYAKGHKELITAIGMLSEKGIAVNLVLVGAGSLSPDVNCLIDKYNLKSKIRYTGLLTNQEELRNELNLADLFVFPSYREGLPRVVIEAMACALPCVATELPGIRELLDDDCLVPVKNSVALMNKIDELIKDPQRLSYISKRNVEKTKKYCFVNMEEKRMKFYKKIKKSV